MSSKIVQCPGIVWVGLQEFFIEDLFLFELACFKISMSQFTDAGLNGMLLRITSFKITRSKPISSGVIINSTQIIERSSGDRIQFKFPFIILDCQPPIAQVFITNSHV